MSIIYVLGLLIFDGLFAFTQDEFIANLSHELGIFPS
jgi:hypothetical protein